jgi:flagellar biosynthesis/type III secretory pathway protein FliH
MADLEEEIRFARPLIDIHSDNVVLNYHLNATTLGNLLGETADRVERACGERSSAEVTRIQGEFLELRNGLFDSLRRAHSKVAEECQKALVDLTIAALERLVAGIKVDAKQVRAAIDEAVQQFEDSAEYEVHLNPEDWKLIAGSDIDQDPKFQIKQNPEIQRGGCIVHTRLGSADARRETKLRLLKRTLEA